MSKQILIELVGENETGYCYADLYLPASAEEIAEAKERANWNSDSNGIRDISIEHCSTLPKLASFRLDSPTLDELNFLAQRLDAMDGGERTIMNGVLQYLCSEKGFADELVSMTDLINMTYGLDGVMIASNVGTDRQLGQFVIDNELNEDVNAIPETSLYLLDLERIGRLQRDVDGGVFVGNCYVVAGAFEMPHVYDGIHLPGAEPPACEQQGIRHTYGSVLTRGLYNAKEEQYPDEVGGYADFIKSHWLGGRTADCVGLIKGYGWLDPDDHEVHYGTNGMPDIGADAMYYNASEKGSISTIPEIPGLAVWKSGHIGIYIGNGQVIHASGTMIGVIQSPLGETGWTHWLKIPYITYLDSNVPTAVNEQRIWDTLYAEIGNPYGTAALMGNLFAESSLRSNNLQDSYEAGLGYTDVTYTQAVDDGRYANFTSDQAGYGLAQWTVQNRKSELLAFANERGCSISDLDMQLAFLCKELETKFPDVLAKLKTASSIREASDYVLVHFEAPYDQSESVKVKRTGYGSVYYSRYGQTPTE